MVSDRYWPVSDRSRRALVWGCHVNCASARCRDDQGLDASSARARAATVCHEGAPQGASPPCSHAAQEMRGGPSQPPCRRRLQTFRPDGAFAPSGMFRDLRVTAPFAFSARPQNIRGRVPNPVPLRGPSPPRAHRPAPGRARVHHRSHAATRDSAPHRSPAATRGPAGHRSPAATPDPAPEQTTARRTLAGHSSDAARTRAVQASAAAHARQTGEAREGAVRATRQGVRQSRRLPRHREGGPTGPSGPAQPTR